MKNDKTPQASKPSTQAKPISIRQRLIRYLLVGLPVLFLLISAVVSLPLYRQILFEEDESMKQFAHMMLNPYDMQAMANELTGADAAKDLTEQSIDIEFAESIADDGVLMPQTAEYAIWDGSGRLLNSSFMDDTEPVNHDTNMAAVTQQHLSMFYDVVTSHLSDKASQGVRASGFINTGNVFSEDAWRLYYSVHPKTREMMVIAQPWRQRLASLWVYVLEQMTVLLLSLPLLMVMVVWAVHKGLRPINQIVSAVEQRHANDLAPVGQAVPKELQPLTTALNRLFQRVSASIDKEKRFTADASHELKSPITAIKLQANELQHSLMQSVAQQTTESSDRSVDGIDNGEILAYIKSLQRIQRTANRASHLVDQLLTLTKLTEQNAQDVEKQPVNWLTVSDDALQSVSLVAREQGVKLVRHIHPEQKDSILPINGNSALLTLLLRNLLDNAIRYGAGGDHVRLKSVELTLTSRNIQIRDHGSGIAPEYLERIHERFFRPAGQTQTGSGLGLSIVERIAQLHGLSVDIDNHREGGVIVMISALDLACQSR